MRHGYRVLLLSVMSGVLFLGFLGRRQFATSHEARVAQVARVMADSGWPWDARPVSVPAVHVVKRLGVLRLAPDPDAPRLSVNPWLVPVLNDEIRLQKPPLPYWCAAVLFRLVGGASEGLARLIPALLGAVTVYFLYDLTRILYGRTPAWSTSLVWLTTYLVPEEYRLAMADPYLAFFTLVAVWAGVRGSGGCLLLTYIALAAGAVAKGPVIFLTVAIPLIAYHVCFRRRVTGQIAVHLLGIVLLLIIALPWPVAVLRHVPNAAELWRYESVGEFSENTENARPWWWYLANLPLLCAPWVPAFIFAVIYPSLRNRSRLFFPSLWFLGSLAMFSFVHLKKDPYLLPAMPGQAMMIGIAVAALLRVARKLRFHGVPGIIFVTQTVISLIFAVVLPVLLWQVSGRRAAIAAVSVPVLVLACWPWRLIRSNRPFHWLVSQTVAYALALLVFTQFYFTRVNNARSPKAVCAEIVNLVDGVHRGVLVSKLPEEVAFYLPLHGISGIAPRQLLWVKDDEKGVKQRARSNKPPPPDPVPEELEGWVPGARVVGVRRVPMAAAPGDARWKVYELTVERTSLAAVHGTDGSNAATVFPSVR